MPAPTTAVLFDYNGTISLDEEIAESILGQAFQERDIPWTRELYFTRLVGHPHGVIVEDALKLLEVEYDQQLVDWLYRREREIALEVRAEMRTISEETADVVRHVASQVPTAVVTSCRREIVVQGLNEADLLGDIVVIIALEDAERSKPHPEPYVRAVQALGVPAAGAVAVEDSGPGLRSARAAGLRVIGVGEFFSPELADAAVPSLADPAFLELLALAPAGAKVAG